MDNEVGEQPSSTVEDDSNKGDVNHQDVNLIHLLAEHLHEGILIIETHGEILFNNPAAELIFESNQKLIGMNLSDFLAKEPFEDFIRQIQHLENKHHVSWTFEIRLPEDKSRRISIHATPWTSQNGLKSSALATIEVLEDDEANEEAKFPYEKHYRAIVEDQINLIFRFVPNDTITYANEAYCRYWGKERSEIIGTSLMRVIPREDRPQVRSQFISLTPACPAVTYETRVIMPNGAIRWQQRTDQAIFDDKNKPVEFISVAHDITERKLAEGTLKHQLAMEEIVMNISTRLIDVIPEDIDHEFQRALRLLGEFLEVELCFLVFFDPGNKTPPKWIKWVSANSNLTFSFPSDQTSAQFPWYTEKINHLEIIRLNRMADLPDEATLEKKFAQEHGIHSFLGLPLVQGNQLVGFLGFVAEKKEVTWLEDEVGLLKVISEIFVSVWIRKRSTEALNDTQIQLNQRIKELENRAREINLLTEMSNMLQIAGTFEETYLIIADYATRLFPGISGSLWINNAETSNLEIKSQWGQTVEGNENLLTEDCWALRRGRLYYCEGGNPSLFCNHIHEPLPKSSICIPILVQGKTVGLLHFESSQENAFLNLTSQQLAAVTAEQVGLALSNLQLREDLREQAIRDPLTSLYNRYYMEISLERELDRAARSLSPVSLMVLDIDRFRDINDRFGHISGDLLLAELGKKMRASIRSADIACRFGGEEFILILPDTPLQVAEQRAKQLKKEFADISVWHEGQRLPTITFSIGLACWPQHARNVYELIRKSTTALQTAKQAGFDRIVASD